MHARRTLGVATALVLSAAPLLAQGAKPQEKTKPATTATSKPAATATATAEKAADSTKKTAKTAAAKKHAKAKHAG